MTNYIKISCRYCEYYNPENARINKNKQYRCTYRIPEYQLPSSYKEPHIPDNTYMSPDEGTKCFVFKPRYSR